MTSFSLLNFKFTQIFLMSQNGFLKMIELSVNAAELLVNAAEFRFFERLLFLSNAIWLNFSEFNRFFLKIDGSITSEIFALHEFSNTGPCSPSPTVILFYNVIHCKCRY
jgi:hypothetical protein